MIRKTPKSKQRRTLQGAGRQMSQQLSIYVFKMKFQDIFCKIISRRLTAALLTIHWTRDKQKLTNLVRLRYGHKLKKQRQRQDNTLNKTHIKYFCLFYIGFIGIELRQHTVSASTVTELSSEHILKKKYTTMQYLKNEYNCLPSLATADASHSSSTSLLYLFIFFTILYSARSLLHFHKLQPKY